MTSCEFCGALFKHNKDRKRHEKYCEKNGGIKKFLCEKCNKSFAREDTLARHASGCNGPDKKRKRKGEMSDLPTSGTSSLQHPPPSSKKMKREHCAICDVDVKNYHGHLRSTTHKNKLCSASEDDDVVCIKSAYKSRIATYKVTSRETQLTPEDFMKEVKERVIGLITCKQAEVQSAVKVNVELFAVFTKLIANDSGKEEEVDDVKSFNTRNKVFNFGGEASEIYDLFTDEIKTKADEFQERDSGWAISKVLHLEVNINKYAPFKGGSYLPLPKWIQDKHACVNVKNADDACFFWAVISALYPAKKSSDRVTSYPQYNDVLITKDIALPITISGIKKFEQQNDISVNIYEVGDKAVSGLLYHTKQRRDKHVNMLYVESGEKAHYCWIKNLSRLVRSQLTKNEQKLWLCDGCLLTFGTESKLKEHNKRDCSQIITTIPSPEDNILKFKNFPNQMRNPVVVYADFEALLTPISGCEPNNSTSFTFDYQKHEPYSYGYYIKCDYDDSLSKYVTYRGVDCAKHFLESLQEELKPFAETLTKNVPMHPLTPQQINDFHSATNCHICGGELGVDRVRDHRHHTGEYTAPAHSSCNLNFKMKHVIPIVFHNLSKYDSHFIIRASQDYETSILPKNKENFISLTIKNPELGVELRFIDSYRFLASSLDKLASNLDPDQFPTIKKHYPENSDLLMKKGVFPYDYIDTMEKLNETTLPPQSSFFNQLNKSHISKAQYEHAQTVWSAFNIGNLGQYSDLYLKTDVLLLAEVFENFRNVCVGTYNLDPAHYYTAPGLSWDAMLKYTGVQMELLTDLPMIKFVASGIRGGLSQCCGKYAAANNKYMKNYEPNQPSNFIVYVDANNQYGWAMSQYMPLKDFRWLSESEIKDFEIMQIAATSATGYILEVDLDYPENLQDSHSDFCFCPENRIPEITTSKTPKLLANLYDKRNYVIHYINLQQAMNMGLILKKIHRVLAFSQSPWLKGYIDLNTELRTKARNAFEKDFYKLMNNAVFGKTMENVEKRVDVRLVNQWESEGKKLGARALISRLNYHSCTIIDSQLTVIQMSRKRVKYDKPIYVGFTVLELSKTLMYDFHYNYIIPKYGSNARLLYTDTDSFIYNVSTDDFFSDIKDDVQERFDTSDYPPDNIYGLPQVNKKVVGKFKDECAGGLIEEFIGIRSKCYYVKREDGDVIKKIKGIKRGVVANEVERKDFYNCISERGSEQYRTMNVIRSRGHLLYSQTLNKITLKNHDDKRFQIPDQPYGTLAWGHKDIEKYYFI